MLYSNIPLDSSSIIWAYAILSRSHLKSFLLSLSCEAVLRKFSRSNLRLSHTGRLGASGQVRPPEAQFQDEWYRVCNSLLGHGFAISSEWSQSGNGRIDFRIVGPDWGIELLRDGDRLAGHWNRVRDKGAYHRWIVDGL